MPEKEGKEVPVNNELMLDRIEFAVDDNEASLVRIMIIITIENIFISWPHNNRLW